MVLAQSFQCLHLVRAHPKRLLDQTVIHHFWILRPINWTHAGGSNRHISTNLLLNRCARLCWVCGCALTNCALARLQRAHDPKRETEAPEPAWRGGHNGVRHVLSVSHRECLSDGESREQPTTPTRASRAHSQSGGGWDWAEGVVDADAVTGLVELRAKLVDS